MTITQPVVTPSDASNAQPPASASPRILLFDLQDQGHHVSYLKTLTSYYGSLQQRTELILAGPRNLVDRCSSNAAPLAKAGVTLREVVIPDCALEPIRRSRFQPLRSIREWRLFQRVCRAEQPDHALAMYFDTLQFGAALDGNLACPWSGIYFRPHFHYPLLPAWPAGASRRISGFRQLALLRAAFHWPQLQQLFCLDPIASRIGSRHGLRLRFCPDPIPQEFEETVAQPTFSLQAADHRTRLLFFGQLSPRKNLGVVVAALELLSTTERSRLELLVAGPAEASSAESTRLLLERIQGLSGLRVHCLLRHLESAELGSLFSRSDVILIPYRQHVGMSSVLVLAARAGKPVISSSFGLVGHLVSKQHLGIVTDCDDPVAVAQAFRRTLASDDEQLCQPAACRRLAERHSAQQFGKAIEGAIQESIS